MGLTNKESAKVFLKLVDFEELDKIGIKPFEGFEIGGYYFLGDYLQAIEHFANNNPNGGDLFVWLQDNWKQIK